MLCLIENVHILLDMCIYKNINKYMYVIYMCVISWQQQGKEMAAKIRGLQINHLV
jgi:hypothetical protein